MNKMLALRCLPVVRLQVEPRRTAFPPSDSQSVNAAPAGPLQDIGQCESTKHTWERLVQRRELGTQRPAS